MLSVLQRFNLDRRRKPYVYEMQASPGSVGFSTRDSHHGLARVRNVTETK